MVKKYILKRTSESDPGKLPTDESKFQINYLQSLNSAQFEPSVLLKVLTLLSRVRGAVKQEHSFTVWPD